MQFSAEVWRNITVAATVMLVGGILLSASLFYSTVHYDWF
jgi:hypothetical protein